MSDTTKPAKKRPGRPRNPDKPEQFSIRLPPILKVGLELIARDRQVSLSQAVETVLATFLRDYKIDGATALTIASDAVADQEGRVDLYRKSADGKILRDEDNAALARYSAVVEKSQLLRIHRFPARLRTTKEQFLLDVAAKSKAFTDGDTLPDSSSIEAPIILVNSKLLALLQDIADSAFRAGLSVDEAAQQLVQLADKS